MATSTRVIGAYKTLHLQRQLPPDVSATGTNLHTRCDPLGVDGWASSEHTAADDEVISTIWGMDEFTTERKKKTCHFSFFSFEVTKLQGSGVNCCSDFILWEAGGCLPEAAAHGVIYIACSLWF